MRTTRTLSSPFDVVPDAVKSFLGRRVAELTGLVLIGATVACMIALATWSVSDPSLNHATNGPVRNLLGRPGAIAADLLMQILGVASVVAIAPLAAWGATLLTRGRIDRLAMRAPLWLLGAIAAAAVASALPTTDRWPLPSGLGGIVGDTLLGLARALGIGHGLGKLVFTGTMIVGLILTYGAALSVERQRNGLDDLQDTDPVPASQDDDARDGDRSLGLVAIGALSHAVLSARASVSRLLLRHRNTAQRDHIGSRTPGIRQEPGFASYAEPHARRPPASGLERSVTTPEPPVPAEIDRPIARVIPSTAAIKPGKRLISDAQPSLLDAQGYQLPPLTMLSEPKRPAGPTVSEDALEQNARLLEGVLDDFGVRGEIINVRPGPVVTLYELEPAPGTKSSRVISLADDIARSMSAVSARVAVVSGRNAIGIELPNQRRETVFLREILASQDFEISKHKLAICLGKTIGGEPVIVDLARMPHLLVAGTTGSGKSVAINTMILSILYRLKPEECRLIMVDPKMLELSVYDGIPHLLTPVVTDPKKAVFALKWAVREMEERYKKMSKLGVRNIEGFNARVAEARAKGETIARTVQTGFDRDTGEPIHEQELIDLDALPFVVVIVDEMADLMMVAGKEIEGTIQRLAQMARAAGIHVILATQRPSVDVITGTIKANFPTRISFQVTSKIDSRTILGEQGAEQLLGQGDMLYMAGGGRITRVHGPYVSDQEVEKVVAHLKSQGKPDYVDDVLAPGDEAPDTDGDAAVFDSSAFSAPGGDVYDQAVAVVLRDRKASTSYIQRRLQIGYNRAASLMERMENEGIVGAPNHAGKREILLEGRSAAADAFDED